jgi:uncharacterized protein YbjT (DUF2867 family)
VIGATGNVGRQVVSQLSAAGAQVRALARNPRAGEFPPGVEIAPADLTKPETLDGPLEGAGAVFLVWVVPRDAVAPALERIVKRVKRVVFLSAPLKTPHPLFQGAQPNPVSALQAEIERLIEASGIEWTFLRPGMLATNSVAWWAPQIRAGDVVRWPYACVPTAPIDERDIAAVAVRALCNEGHAGAEYVLTGPQSLSQAEQVEIIGRAIGRPLRMQEISPDDARRELVSVIPAPAVKMLLGAWEAAIGRPAFVTSTVADVTGVPARTFLDWAADHTEDFLARSEFRSTC